MKFKFSILTFLFLAAVFSGCGGEKSQRAGKIPANTAVKTQVSAAALNASTTAALREGSPETAELLNSLDGIAQLERAGSWVQGIAIAESSMRESAGDYAGALAAAYKELAWAYGRGLIQKEDIEAGLLNVLALKNEETVTAAANAILAFVREQWGEAYAGLLPFFDNLDEPDSFGRWMILVCALEQNRDDRRAGAFYKAIRARYAHFPEYWYRGAKAFSGIAGAEYAENCINSSPNGPFAGECRNILAAFSGLKRGDAPFIKTKTEIETIITKSFNAGNPVLLDSLFPLISLPDNPYTVYAVNSLRSLTSIPKFRDFLTEQAESSKGRLAERLSYICRG